MTAPGSSDSPVSRRAAREQREEAARRARISDATAPLEVVLPGDPTALTDAPSADPSPFLLPAEVRAAVAQRTAPRASAPAPAQRARVRRRAAPVDPRRSARRSARAELLLADEGDGAPPRHVRTRRIARSGVVLLLAAGGVLLLGSTAAVTALVSGAQNGAVADVASGLADAPPTVAALPVPIVEQSPVSADVCGVPGVMTALEKHDDAGAIEAAGGAEAFRVAVVEGRARCVDLADPSRVWVVVNKQRPYDPVSYRPTGLVMPDGVRSLEGGSLRSDAASALTAMVTAAREAGVGEIALESGFRSYETQQGSYGRQVAERGQEAAELVSARPGYSEHQSGLAGDVVACAGGCGTLDDLAGTAQGEWIAAHSWEHGWIVRYVDGATGMTGYSPEPWHLRYIGPELARAYHDGGWTSLEEFFGLEAAPDYAE